MLQPRASQHVRESSSGRQALSGVRTCQPLNGASQELLRLATAELHLNYWAQLSPNRPQAALEEWHPNSATGRPHGHHIPDGCVWTALFIHAGRWVERAAGDEHVLARQIGRRVEASRPQFPPPRSAHHFSSRSVGRNVLAGHHYADVRRARENYLHGHSSPRRGLSSPLPSGMMVIRIECGV